MTTLAAQTATFACLPVSQWGRSEGGEGRRGSYSQLTVACLNVDDRPFSITYLILIALNMCVHAAHTALSCCPPLPHYPSTLLSLSAPLSFLVSVCVWRILFVALSTCFHIERCHLPDLVDDPASSCYSLFPCFPLLLLLPSSSHPLAHVPRLSHVCCLPPSPSLSVYLASAASFYELCRALMLITL